MSDGANRLDASAANRALAQVSDGLRSLDVASRNRLRSWAEAQELKLREAEARCVTVTGTADAISRAFEDGDA